jgi:hypothetical protein
VPELPFENPDVLAASGLDEVDRMAIDRTPPAQTPPRRRDDLDLFAPQALVASP